MSSVTNSVQIPYTSANVGVLTPPDKIGRAEFLSASQMEKELRTLKSDIYQKQKHVSFEDKKTTPIVVKITGIVLGAAALLKGGAYALSKFKRP